MKEYRGYKVGYKNRVYFCYALNLDNYETKVALERAMDYKIDFILKKHKV